MTDNEIIQALECCVEGKSESCLKCVFRLTPYPVCKTLVGKHAIDIINRQKADSEHLKQMYEASIAGQETLQKYFVRNADVVEVVRCKDCVSSRMLNRKDRFENAYDIDCVYCMLHDMGMRRDGFCSDGERKTDENRH